MTTNRCFLFPWYLSFSVPIPYSLYFWCTGEDSNLRSSKERQIYSLLPLTARPPVPICPSVKKPGAGNSTQLCAGCRLPHPFSVAAAAEKGGKPSHPCQNSIPLIHLRRTPQLPVDLRNFPTFRLKWIRRGVKARPLLLSRLFVSGPPAGQLLPLSSPVPASVLVELAKGFEPPTL
jgi:hypothetical protein